MPGLRIPISIHALREEGDSHAYKDYAAIIAFLSTPSARRATGWPHLRPAGAIYFYPRPPRGGRRVCPPPMWTGCRNFYPRPPRGGRPCASSVLHRQKAFLSTPSARRATFIFPSGIVRLTYFYPRPPRGGRLQTAQFRIEVEDISIHALREEGDTQKQEQRLTALEFLSTPSARRAT